MSKKTNITIENKRLSAAFFMLVSAMAFVSDSHAATVGLIIFTTGDVYVSGRPAKVNSIITETDSVKAKEGSLLYLKTSSNKLMIFRYSNSDASRRARQEAAVKVARQNFRFNTPIAAIGIRG